MLVENKKYFHANKETFKVILFITNDIFFLFIARVELNASPFFTRTQK